MFVFKPIIRLMNSLKFTYKFLLIGAIFLCVLILISTNLMGYINEEVEEIVERKEGAKYSLLLKDTLQMAQQHRGMSVNKYNGDEEATANLSLIKEDMASAMVALQSFESALHYDFKVQDYSAKMQSLWIAIDAKEDWSNTGDIISAHAELTELIIEMMLKVSNESRLLIARSQESSNLIMSISKTLPNLTEKLGVIRATTMSVLGTGELNEAELHNLNEQYYTVKQDIQTLQYDLSIAFKDEMIKDGVQPSYEVANRNIEAYLALVEQVIIERDLSINKDEFYTIATQAINTQFDTYNTGLVFLTDLISEQQEGLESKKKTVLIIQIVVVLLVTYLFIGFYLGTQQSIRSMRQVTEEIANGNLTVKADFKTKDEMLDIEKSLNKMIQSLNDIVQQISTSSEYVAASSEELHAGVEETTASITHVAESVEQMAEGAKTEAVNIERASTQLDNMANGVNEIVEASQVVYTLAKDSTDLANQGNESVRLSEQQMQIIQQSVQETSETIQTLNNRSKEIEQILSLITGIAEQTNLLSLNAAIEAARAGEQGKGFAVVANEVGALASQSRNAVALVATIVQAIQQDTTKSVVMMESVKVNVVEGLEISTETAQKFEFILKSMQNLVLRMEGISSSSEQVSVGTQQVVASMSSMMMSSQQNAVTAQEIAASTEEQNASMEEMASSATELAKMAEDLQNLIQRFKL